MIDMSRYDYRNKRKEGEQQFPSPTGPVGPAPPVGGILPDFSTGGPGKFPGQYGYKPDPNYPAPGAPPGYAGDQRPMPVPEPGIGPWTPTPISGPASPIPAPMLGPTGKTFGIAGRGGGDRGDYDRGGGGGGYGGGGTTLPGSIGQNVDYDLGTTPTPVGGTTDTGYTPPPGGMPWRPTTTKQAQWEHAKKFPGAAANVGQEWLRDPSWGGHVIWNPDLGYQDFSSMAKLYSEAGGPVTQEQMMGWGLTPQMGPDWREFFPDRQTKGERGWTPGGGTGGTLGGDMVGQPAPAYGGDIYGNFPYPPEWGLAGNVLSNFATGLPTQIPQSWEDMLGYSQEWAEGGKPGDTSAWFEAQMPGLQRQIEDQSKELAEQYGMAGLGWSSPLQRSQTEMTGRASENLWSQAMTQQMGLDESAKARAMAALPMMFQQGAGITGLAESAKNRGMQAAGGLMGLGQQRANLPMQVAQGLGQSGYAQTGLAQSDIDRQTAEWMRLLPENSPWLQYAQGAGGQAGQSPYAYPQYNPSSQTQWMQTLSSMMPWLMQMFNQPDGGTSIWEQWQQG